MSTGLASPNRRKAFARIGPRVPAGARMLAVFGAGGDRDPAKRPRMGEVVSRLADVAVVTSDNPRSEDPAAIVEAIVAGMAGPAERRVEPDRRAAIALALDAARPRDLVVVAAPVCVEVP